jgi:hypothetical protein
MSKPPEEEVRVMRQEMTIFPQPGKAERVYAITFITSDLGPRTIFIPVSQWSPEVEKAEDKGRNTEAQESIP